MLSGGDGVGGGGVHDQTAMLGSGGQIHIVNTHAGPADDLEPATGGLEDLAADLGAAADDEGVAEGDLGAELLGGEVVGAIDVGEVLEEVEPGLAELLGDEDRRLRVEACRDDEDEPTTGVVAAAGAEGDRESGGERELGGERKGGGGGGLEGAEAEGLGS